MPKWSNRVRTADTVSDVPNQPKTPKRSVRVPDGLWEAAKEKARARGESVTAVIVRALKEYVARD